MSSQYILKKMRADISVYTFYIALIFELYKCITIQKSKIYLELF